MSEEKKSMLQKIKAFFEMPVAPVAPVVELEEKLYKLKDGTDISIKQKGEAPAVNDIVLVAGMPALDGDHELEDGTKVTTVSGVISAIVMPEPVTVAPEELAVDTPKEKTVEERLSAIESALEVMKTYSVPAPVIPTGLATEIQLSEVNAKLAKQDEVIKMQFELLEQIVATSTADPVTLTGNKKDRFDKLQTREDKFKAMADNLKKAKQN